ncbi:phage portal protein [Burkholderia thailandensis]|nr:phage portal protein [Burkholderia thailandensis]MCS3390258.1 phage portal protein [Burkholderia thailandensis]MCS6425800.1 phage portal protein [Burkholderia thailandensis]MCS6454216.1 phage portal protein [Burkholderia thailandensis]MCS6462454.1 phage portal protein [Burkholderia thailandensis]MCS6483276.1 phage portal protein [Burkholderia thailandensis]
MGVDSRHDLLAFSAVYACVDRIASDISKLGIRYVKQSGNIWQDASAPRFTGPLRRPNPYQNRIQFVKAWQVSKLLAGNAYILLVRDMLRNVAAMYVLDPARVIPLVAPSGAVFYQVAADPLRGLPEQVTIPASEIIHDRGICPWHPLIGVSPIVAAAAAGTMGNRIQQNSRKFFGNMSRPGGILSAPGKISDETANRLKTHWETNYGGENAGRLAVVGDGLKYETVMMTATDAQLVEQLRWAVEDVARCYHVPLYKIGADPTGSKTAANIGALEQSYYTDCLQAPIEELELCLDDGFEVPDGQGFDVDVRGLLRMDPAARYDAHSKAVGGGWMAPNEARAAENMPPVPGGDTPYLQQQNYSLDALAKRDKNPAPSSATLTSTSESKEPANGN